MLHRWRRTCTLTFGLGSLFVGEAFGQDEKKDAPKDPLPKVGVEAEAAAAGCGRAD